VRRIPGSAPPKSTIRLPFSDYAPHRRPRAEEVGRPPTRTKGGARRAREEELGGAACVRARRSSAAHCESLSSREEELVSTRFTTPALPPLLSLLPQLQSRHHGTFLSLCCRSSTTPSADAHRQPPPVAHPPILGLECVPLILRMLPDLYSLVRTSLPTRNGRVKPAAD
jgi:hypothetical protein